MAKSKRKATILKASLVARTKYLLTSDFKALVKSLPKTKPKKVKKVDTGAPPEPRRPRVKKVVDSASTTLVMG